MKCKRVAKFGGTSVKTASAIAQVAKIIKKDTSIAVVVVSAVGGVTNLLFEFCTAENTMARLRLRQQILDVHKQLIEELKLDILNKIESKIAVLDEIISIADVELSVESIDQILALGEDLSSMIVHAYLCSQDLHIRHLDAREYLKTNSYFGKAAPDLAAIGDYVFPPENLIITQGFVGSTLDQKTTTLGRGGSDYSAALIAEAIGANELLIYTDVPGVYTMDPNIVTEARLISEISFAEMAEMANFGAKILHPATLEPCLRAQIPVRILSTFAPDNSGTFINISKISETPSIRAITMRYGQVLVILKSLEMLDTYGFLADIFEILAKYKVCVDLVTTSEVSVALTIDSGNSNSWFSHPFVNNSKLFNDLAKFAEVLVEEDLTLVAVVGSGLTVPGTIQKTLKSIEPYMIRLVCYGASNSSISLLVKKEDAYLVAKILHQQLLEKVDCV